MSEDAQNEPRRSSHLPFSKLENEEIKSNTRKYEAVLSQFLDIKEEYEELKQTLRVIIWVSVTCGPLLLVIYLLKREVFYICLFRSPVG